MTLNDLPLNFIWPSLLWTLLALPLLVLLYLWLLRRRRALAARRAGRRGPARPDRRAL